MYCFSSNLRYNTYIMKSRVILSRQMKDVVVRQDSKTKFFNANDLVQAYNMSDSKQKHIHHYLSNDSTKRYMDAIIKDEIDNTRNSVDLENSIIQTKRGKYGGTWMHPYLFIDFAMWLSPEFKVTVIKWVYDNLIQYRLDAGDSFKEVNAALFDTYPNSPPFVYANEAKMINKLVFGNPNRGQRDSADEKQLEILKQLQNIDVKLIKEGVDYYDRYDRLREFMKYLV